ncbi:MAG: SDR family oxidoreductase, partial [Caulobacteraceae bacterium]|nr:SDR family oxidoreductase [Caulobacter sp.]
MRVFLTGATGFIGSRIVPELIDAGHRVLGLTRSDAGAEQLRVAGAEAHRGGLEDPDSLAEGAASADAVIHTAFDHDFSRFVENCEKDRRVIRAMGAALAGTDKPLIITSGTGMGAPGPGRLAREDVVDWNNPNPRIASEAAGAEVAEQGASVAVVRLPQVHDPVKQGLIAPMVAIAREKGVSAYVGDGANRWPAAHVSDVARLYRLALDHHDKGARYHAVDEEGMAGRVIAEAIGAGLGVPVVSLSREEAPEH